jgi:integrase
MAKTKEKAAPQKAITKDVLEKLLTTCDGSVKGIRDKAILLLAWASGGFQRSNLVAAQAEHITSMGNDLLLHIPVHNAKTGCAINVPVKGRAAQALLNWRRWQLSNKEPYFEPSVRMAKSSIIRFHR